MNPDSTVSADKLSADAEGVAEQVHSVPDDVPPPDGNSKSPDSAAGSEEVSSAPETRSDAQAVPTGLEEAAPEAKPRDETESNGATEADAAAAGAAGASERGTVDRPGAPDEPRTKQQQSVEEPGKRKVRLNPTLAGGQAKAVPSLKGEATVAPVPAEEAPEAGPEDVAGVQSEEAESNSPPPAPTTPVEVPDSDALDADMEAEIAAALGSGEGEGGAESETAAAATQAAEAAADDSSTPSEDELTEGAKLQGVIQSIHEDNVFLDFGLRQSGVVSKRQFGAKREPKVGDKIDVVVTKVDETEGLIVCSLPRGAARISGDWNALVVGQTVECMVTKTNKGGLEVTVSNLRGFMPASQVDIGYVSDLTPFVGQKLTARVTEVNPGRRRLVLSRRAVLEEERAEQEAELLAEIEIGQTRTGKIKTIKDYGAFVDLGGMDGFLHIGQMSWTRIEHPSELLSEGQDVEVKVLTIEPDKKHPDKKRIGLGMRQLIANPWSNVEDKFPKGSTQTGKVTRTENYGAFVELEPGVEGLVHISELDHQRVKRVEEVLNVGQQTDVQVLEVDRKRKRISLSVKALTAAPEPETNADEDLAPGGGQPYERKRKDGLKGGIGGTAPGGLFGNPSDFS